MRMGAEEEILERKERNEKFLSTLPQEIWIMILGYLPLLDLIAVSKVCFLFRSFSHDPILWTSLTFPWLSIFAPKEQSVRLLVGRCTTLKELNLVTSGKAVNKIRERRILCLNKDRRGIDEDWSIDAKIKQLLTSTSWDTLRRLKILVPLSSSTIAELANLTKLEELYLNGMGCEEDRDCADLHWEKGLITVIQNNPGLEKLVLRDFAGFECKLTDDVLLALSENCRSLKSLDIKPMRNGYLKFTDSGMETLFKNCRKLKRMVFPSCWEVTDESLKFLAENCPVIKEVEINIHTRIQNSEFNRMGITDDVVKTFVNATKNLQKFSIYFPVKNGNVRGGTREELVKILSKSHPNLIFNDLIKFPE